MTMSGIPRPRPPALRACVVLAALAGCAPSQPTRFYTLSTVTEPAEAPRSGQGLVIGLGSLTLPQYPDRPDIVTRAGANQMKLGEFRQWAEPLEPLLRAVRRGLVLPAIGGARHLQLVGLRVAPMARDGGPRAG
jgi:uncharacterized lipoprotein YmbA